MDSVYGFYGFTLIRIPHGLSARERERERERERPSERERERGGGAVNQAPARGVVLLRKHILPKERGV
jgi:hypothetical protein